MIGRGDVEPTQTIILLLALTVPAAAGGQHYECGNLNATLTTSKTERWLVVWDGKNTFESMHYPASQKEIRRAPRYYNDKTGKLILYGKLCSHGHYEQ